MSVALIGPAFADDLTVSTKTTSPVTTSTAANGTPGNITIGSTGSVEITTAEAAVTLNSSNTVTNNGNITNTTPSGGTGVHILGNNTGSFINFGNISLPGNATTSTTLNGVLLDGNGTFTGNIVTMSGSSLSMSGFDANALAIYTELNGNLTNGGGILSKGPGSTGIVTSATIDGTFINTGTITTGVASITNTLIDPSPGSAVGIGGSVLGGIRNAGPLNGTDTTPRAIVATDGSAAAFIIAPSVGGNIGDITIGTIADITNPNNSFINRGNITAAGTDPTVSTIAMQVGNTGATTNSYETVFLNGLYNSGFIVATATSDNGNATLVVPQPTNAAGLVIGLDASVPVLTNDANGVISAATGGVAGGNAVGLSILGTANLPTLNNSGTLSASATTTNTGISSLSAYAILDSSGKLTTINNSGTITATATTLDTGFQNAVAADLSVTTSAITFNNTGIVTGDIRFGSSTANQLNIEGAGAIVTGKIGAAGLGRVNIAVSGNGTGGTLATNGTIRAGTLTVGSGGTLDIGVGTGTTAITATGAVSFAATAHLDVRPVALLPTDATITLIHSDTSLTFADYAASTTNIEVPFLFNGNLSVDAKNLKLSLQRKTATELGLAGNNAILYEPAMQAAATDAELGAALSTLASSNEVKDVLDQLAPVANNASRAMFDAVTDNATGPVGNRQRSLMFAPASETGKGVWVESLYSMVKDTGGLGYSGNGIGGTIGFEYATEHGHAGIAMTYFRGTASENSTRNAETAAQWFMVSPYVGVRVDNMFVDGQLNIGAGSVRNGRTVETGTVTRMASGKTKEAFVTGGVTGGYIFNFGSFQISPEVSLTGMYLGDSNYRETGAGPGVDLSIEARSMTAMTAFIGVAGQGTYDSFGGRLTPHFLGGWSHDVVQNTPDINAYFTSVPSSDFAVTGPTLDRSRFVGAANLDFVWNRWQVGLGYNAAVRANAIAQTANFTAVRRF